jgi:hypothetical protein
MIMIHRDCMIHRGSLIMQSCSQAASFAQQIQ